MTRDIKHEKPVVSDMSGLFAEYAGRSVRRIIGLMSGTSADGVHAALVELSGAGVETSAKVLAFLHEHYDADFRSWIFQLFDPHCPVSLVCEMNFALGEVFAGAALKLAEQHRGIESIDFDRLPRADGLS